MQKWGYLSEFLKTSENIINYWLDISICIQYDFVDHITAEEQLKSFCLCLHIFRNSSWTLLFVHNFSRISNSILSDVGCFPYIATIKYNVRSIFTLIKNFLQSFKFLLLRWSYYVFYILHLFICFRHILNKFIVVMSNFIVTIITRAVAPTKITVSIIFSCELISQKVFFIFI